MDRFDVMSVLLAVVEEGSLSAGARRLGVPLTTISRKVSDLERHLQTRLLNRTTRHLGLTEAGRAYVAAARRIVEMVAEAERAAAGEYSLPRGELAVTAPIVFGRRHLLPVVADFLAAHPAIHIRMSLVDRSLDLIEDHVDVALRIGPLADTSLVATRVGFVRRVVCASPGYLERHGVPQVPEDLRTHEAVAFQNATGPVSDWNFSREGRTVTVALKPRLAVNTAEAAVDAACAGLGVTRVLSYQVADEVASGTLRVLLDAHEPEPLPVSFIHPGQGLLPRKTRAFLDWCVPRIRARLAARSSPSIHLAEE